MSQTAWEPIVRATVPVEVSSPPAPSPISSTNCPPYVVASTAPGLRSSSESPTTGQS